MQGMEQTIVEDGPAAPQLGKPVPLNSYLWEGMKEKFLKGQPKVLGAMQIMTGLMILGTGVVIMCGTLPYYGPRPLSVCTLYSIWGSVMFIFSGSFSVAAARRTTRGLVQASLTSNIISAVFAGAGMIISIVSLSISAPFPFTYYYHQSSENCQMTASILIGLDGVVLLLSVLEFCVAVSVSSFGCKAICCYLGGVLLVLPSNPHTTETSPAPLGGDSMAPTDAEKSAPGNAP